MKSQEKHLHFLNELSDYKVENKYPDVREWVVKDSALRNIGKVKNLLVDKLAKRVVYLDVEVDKTIIDKNHDPYQDLGNLELREYLNEKGENHIVIPMGLVDINIDEEYVFTKTIDHTTFANTKRNQTESNVVSSNENINLEPDSISRKKGPIKSEVVGKISDNPQYQEKSKKVGNSTKLNNLEVTGNEKPGGEEERVDWFDAEHGQAEPKKKKKKGGSNVDPM